MAATSAVAPAEGPARWPRLAEDGSPYRVTVYAPAKKGFDGWCATLVVTLVVDDQNVVTEVVSE